MPEQNPRTIAADRISESSQEHTLEPDAEARAALAARLGIPAIEALSCRFSFRRARSGLIRATGMLSATLTREDVATLEPFTVSLEEPFALRFVPEEKLSDQIDPADLEDEVGYRGNSIDLAETMAQQLALSLDPYPRNSAPG